MIAATWSDCRHLSSRASAYQSARKHDLGRGSLGWRSVSPLV